MTVTGCGEQARNSRDASADTHEHSLMCSHEDGLDFTTSGSLWANRKLSASFMPDGVSTGGVTSGLFAQMDAIAPRDVWQREFARALATWSAVAPMDFRIVADNGAAGAVAGLPQADARFGDVRLSSRALPSGAGYTYYPTTGGTNGGDLYLNTGFTNFKIGQHFDVYSVVLHELGHSMGLAHSGLGTVMFQAIMGVYSGLQADDVAGIQSRYGTRAPDSYDQAAANDQPSSASPVAVAAVGQTFVVGDLTTASDVDHYRIVVPAGAASVLSVTALAGESLLHPTLRLYAADGTLIDEVSAAKYGEGALMQLAGVVPGEAYVVAVDAVADEAFTVGGYRLAIEFRGAQNGLPYAPPAALAQDSYEINDSFELSKDLGQTSQKTVTGLSINWAWDEDYYHFTTATAAKTYEVSLALGAGSQPLAVQILSATGALLAQSSNGVVSFAATKSTTYKVRVFSPSRTPRGYSLTVRKVN